MGYNSLILIGEFPSLISNCNTFSVPCFQPVKEMKDNVLRCFRILCTYHMSSFLSFQLWDLSGHLLSSFHGHTGHVRCCVFSSDDRLLVTASLDHTVKVEH